jgi:hypothetical protein
MENKRFIGCYQYSRGTKIKLGCFFESGDDIHRYFVYGLIPVAPFSTPPQLEGLSILALDKRSIEMVSKSAEKKDIFVLDIKAITDRYVFVPEGITDVFGFTAKYGAFSSKGRLTDLTTEEKLELFPSTFVSPSFYTEKMKR